MVRRDGGGGVSAEGHSSTSQHNIREVCKCREMHCKHWRLGSKQANKREPSSCATRRAARGLKEKRLYGVLSCRSSERGPETVSQTSAEEKAASKIVAERRLADQGLR